jgi:hypothetical protein
MANVLRYFPTQALNFAFKDTIKGMFKTAKDAPQYEKFGKNILSGGVAGSMSLLFVYSLDYCRTRYISPLVKFCVIKGLLTFWWKDFFLCFFKEN